MKSSTIGKILGGLGLLLLLSSPYTLFITTGNGWMAGGKALLGVLLIGAFFATNFGQLGQFASRKSTFFILSSVMTVLVLVGALGAVNFIAAKKNKKWDLTSKKIFSLAEQTQSTLKGLTEPVKAIGFIPSDHPYYDALDDLFRRYHEAAPEKFEYSFKDPKKNPDQAAKYQLKEGQTTVVLLRGQGEKESHTTLNVLSEQELTNALIKINGVGQQKIYFVQGHGEPPLSAEDPQEGAASLSELKTNLEQEGYSPEPLPLAGKTEIPKDAALVVVVGAKIKLTENEVAPISKYLEQGGRLLYLAESQSESGLEPLLAQYGIQVETGLVADNQFAVDSPYNVLSAFFSKHEIAKYAKQMSLQFPLSRGLTVLKEGTAAGVTAEPVVLTSPNAWIETTVNDSPSPSSGEKTGQIALVAASTRNTSAAADKRYDEARVVVVGSYQIILDVNWGHTGNRNLLLNAFAWASNQVQKITIRPPDRDISTLDLDVPLLAKIRFLATDLLPLGILGIGLAIWISRRNK